MKLEGRELDHGEHGSGHQCGGPAIAQAAASVDHEHQYERHQQGQERNLTPDHLTQGVLGQLRNLGQRDDGDRDRPEGNGRRVGHQRHRHRLDRPEAEAHHHHTADCDRRAEAGEGLEQGTEAEGDDDHLNRAGRWTPS